MQYSLSLYMRWLDPTLKIVSDIHSSEGGFITIQMLTDFEGVQQFGLPQVMKYFQYINT